jgi:cysteine desulfurase/selenocysteine lyase
MEHHSNLVPWQRLCREAGAHLRVVGVDEKGELQVGDLLRWLGPRTKLFAFTHVSIVLGTINPAARLVELAHARGVPVLIDGAQAVPHIHADMQAIGCDFYAFSSHKVYGPMGIGALYGRAALLEEMQPWQSGGEMVQTVSFEETTFQKPPHRFEAGTPDVGAAVGLHAALDFVASLEGARDHERALLERGKQALREIPGLRLLGDAADRIGLLSFALEGIHPHDAGTVLDQEGVAVRTGHLCAQPLLRRFGVQAVVRASLAAYNRMEEIDALAAALHRVRETFA